MSEPSPTSPVLSRLTGANRAARRARLKMELMHPFEAVEDLLAGDDPTLMPSIVEEEEGPEELQQVPTMRQLLPPQMSQMPQWLQAAGERYVPHRSPHRLTALTPPPCRPTAGDKRRRPLLDAASVCCSSLYFDPDRASNTAQMIAPITAGPGNIPAINVHEHLSRLNEHKGEVLNRMDFGESCVAMQEEEDGAAPQEGFGEGGDLRSLLDAACQHRHYCRRSRSPLGM